MDRPSALAHYGLPRRWRGAPILVFLLAAVVWLLAGPVPVALGGAAHQVATPTPLVRPGGRFEEDDARLRYTGTWSTVIDSRASGGTLRRSSQRGATVQLAFPGQAVKWVTTRGPDRGVAHVFIDDVFRTTVDLYAAEEQFQSYVVSFLTLDPGQNHTIRIVVTGERREPSTGSIVDIDAFIVDAAEAPDTLRFEDTDPAVTFSSPSTAWNTIRVDRASGGTVHRSNQAGATAQLTFSDNSVLWVTSRGPDRGIARVFIDDQLRESVDLYRSNGSFQETFMFDELGGGPHTIRIEVTGTRTGVASNSYVDVDAFVVPDAPTAPVATPTVAPTATRTPIPTATPAVLQPTATPRTPATSPAPAAVRDARYFSQTSFRIDHDPFWEYFNARGGVGTFGYPVSRTFPFLGCTTQFFQRHVLQQCQGMGVQPLNLLDPDLMPVTRVNGSIFPAHDPAVAARAPAPSTPEYNEAVLAHLVATVPSTFEGLPVDFFSTYMETVPPDPQMSVPSALRNLELWGFPTSGPAFDPNNRGFVYQRFQRGIMHYRTSTGSTEAVLLGDYFKRVITGQNVPPDLAAQAAGSPFLRQYCPDQPDWICRPAELRSTDLSLAFEPQ